MSAVPNNSNNSNEGVVGYRLDPADWDEYRSQMHQLLDECCDRMKSYRDLPWKPPPPGMQQDLQMANGEDKATKSGRPLRAVMDELVQDIMPYATGNTHPKFMGWVHGAGLPSSTVRIEQDQCCAIHRISNVLH